MDIREFLTARLAEDEAAARGMHAIGGAPWHLLEWYDGEFEDGQTARVDLHTRTGAITIRGALPRPVGAHIIRHDPARVLAEIAAKRQLLHEIDLTLRPLPGYPDSHAHERPAGRMLRTLAAAYADHPDYDPAWKA